MGIKSTDIITRERAIEIVMSRLLTATDKQLESMAEIAYDSDFTNFLIMSAEAQQRQKELDHEEFRAFVEFKKRGNL